VQVFCIARKPKKTKKKEEFFFRLFLSPHSLSVTTVTLGSGLFFNSAANKLDFFRLQQ
jgi:hypothetical protein